MSDQKHDSDKKKPPKLSTVGKGVDPFEIENLDIKTENEIAKEFQDADSKTLDAIGQALQQLNPETHDKLLLDSDLESASDQELSGLTDVEKKQKAEQLREQKRRAQEAMQKRRDAAKQNPAQRKQVMEVNHKRGDLIEPESQRAKNKSGMTSWLKEHPLMNKKPKGTAVNLGGDPSVSPNAQARAEQSPELTPVHKQELQAKAELAANPTNAPKPSSSS